MKIKSDYVLRSIADMHVVVTVGEAAHTRNSLFSLNDTGATLWETLKNPATKQDLIDVLLQEYDVETEEAEESVEEFLNTLRQLNILDE